MIHTHFCFSMAAACLLFGEPGMAVTSLVLAGICWLLRRKID